MGDVPVVPVAMGFVAMGLVYMGFIGFIGLVDMGFVAIGFMGLVPIGLVAIGLAVPSPVVVGIGDMGELAGIGAGVVTGAGVGAVGRAGVDGALAVGGLPEEPPQPTTPAVHNAASIQIPKRLIPPSSR
jgi:hypothetical protein